MVLIDFDKAKPGDFVVFSNQCWATNVRGKEFLIIGVWNERVYFFDDTRTGAINWAYGWTEKQYKRIVE